MSTANETQVGGTHYKSSFQHWDLAHELDLGYFEGQITKYVTRHHNKKGREDLEKALHFAEKLRELSLTGDRQPRYKYATSHQLNFFQLCNQLPLEDITIIRAVLGWQTTTDLEVIVGSIGYLLDTVYPPMDSVKLAEEALERSSPVMRDINADQQWSTEQQAAMRLLQKPLDEDPYGRAQWVGILKDPTI